MQTSTFSDPQLAGQRLMVGFDGTTLTADLQYYIERLKIGGIILFSRNLETEVQIKQLCDAVQNHARMCGQPPLFIAVDQEGGQVARLKEPFTQFPGNPHMKSEADAVHFAEVTAVELKRIGINMNMAPVMDVAPENFDSIMAKRAFGGDPHWVARLGVKVIANLQQNNIIAVAKHFPGIGRTILDSHFDLPVLDSDISEIGQLDLIPFKASIAHGVCGMMLSHILYPKLDSCWPASLSHNIAGDLLRKHLGFDGLVLTDDLDMGAISRHYDIQSAISRISEVGIDLVLICHQGPKIEIAFETLLQGIVDSADSRAQGIASAERIMRVKNRYLNSESA